MVCGQEEHYDCEYRYATVIVVFVGAGSIPQTLEMYRKELISVSLSRIQERAMAFREVCNKTLTSSLLES